MLLDNKEKQTEAIIWFHIKTTGENEITLPEINRYFERASLPKLNVTRAKTALAKSRNVCRGSKVGTYRLTLPAISQYEQTFGYLWEAPPKIEEVANIYETPFLSRDNIDQAKRMAELYIVLNCYENSVRSLITRVFQMKFGDRWPEIILNTHQKNKVDSRKEAERKHSWLTPRNTGNNPLYYLDWTDLLSLIRNFEADFIPFIKEIKFVELRFEELEKVRNITAHNGYLPNPEDYQRVILSFKDWCHQIKGNSR